MEAMRNFVHLASVMVQKTRKEKAFIHILAQDQKLIDFGTIAKRTLWT